MTTLSLAELTALHEIRELKAQYAFHFRDRNTAMIALNNIVYTLKRR